MYLRVEIGPFRLIFGIAVSDDTVTFTDAASDIKNLFETLKVNV